MVGVQEPTKGADAQIGVMFLCPVKPQGQKVFRKRTSEVPSGSEGPPKAQETARRSWLLPSETKMD